MNSPTILGNGCPKPEWILHDFNKLQRKMIAASTISLDPVYTQNVVGRCLYSKCGGCVFLGCLTPVFRRRIVLSEFRFRYPVSSVLRSISSVSKCQVSSGQSVQFSKFSKFSKFRKAQVNQFSQQMPGKFSSSKQMPGQLILRLIRSISPVQ